MTTLCLKNSSITESEINKNSALCNLCLSMNSYLKNNFMQIALTALTAMLMNCFLEH